MQTGRILSNKCASEENFSSVIVCLIKAEMSVCGKFRSPNKQSVTSVWLLMLIYMFTFCRGLVDLGDGNRPLRPTLMFRYHCWDGSESQPAGWLFGWMVGSHWTFAKINCYYRRLCTSGLLSAYQRRNKTLLSSLSSGGGFRKQQVWFAFICTLTRV